MKLARLYAQLNCSDLAESAPWFERLFERAPDARPMAGLAEWLHGDAAGLQLFENADHAGHGVLTLIVSGLEREYKRLEGAGLGPGKIEPATSVNLLRLRDPDDNLVVLAEPKQA